MKSTMLFLFALILTGGISNSSIIPIGKDAYMVNRHAAMRFNGSGTLKAEAFQEADAYCVKLGRTL